MKSCVGTTWCRYGVQDSVGFAIRVENRYKGIRAPHKIKMAVSGCIRECAEAQSKDFGLIATEKGYNLYVCGNGGSKPRHADLLAADLDEETALKYIDRFLMYYIQTADRLTRTSVWLRKLEGGIEHLRDVVIHDKLGIAAELERGCSTWSTPTSANGPRSSTIPSSASCFRQFVNTDETEPCIEIVTERGQSRPADWPRRVRLAASSSACSTAARSAKHRAKPARRCRAAVGRGRQRRRLPARRRRDDQVRQVADRRLQLRQPRRVVRQPEHVPAQEGVRALARHHRHARARAEGRLPAAQEDVFAGIGRVPVAATKSRSRSSP